MRLWVEMTVGRTRRKRQTSASLWGCELKYDWMDQAKRDAAVSLFMRLWVEILNAITGRRERSCQPLYEAVSWNAINCNPFMAAQYVSLFMRLWVEMFWKAYKNYKGTGQPLYEAVSWNAKGQGDFRERKRSASLWGCELKYFSLLSG